MLDRASGELVPCNAARCPYAINGVNHAPFAAFGGWSGAVNVSADAKVKDAAYDFFSFMAQAEQSNEDVTIGITGMNPTGFLNLSPSTTGLELDLARQQQPIILEPLKPV